MTQKDLEREMKNKEDEFRWRNNIEIYSGGQKMRNVSGQQGENERYWKKKRVFDTQAVDLLPDA